MPLQSEPRVITRPRRELDLKSYRFRRAEIRDYTELLTSSTILRDEASGRVRVVYLVLSDDCNEIVQSLRSIQFEIDERASGMLSQSRIFGYRPRITIRDDFCTTAALAREHPFAYKLISSYAAKVSDYYHQFNPELFIEHQRIVGRVLPEWRLEGSVFTSGIINKNNPLPYHFDQGNFQDVWSNMLVFKHQIGEGYLSVPEYDIGFEVAHNSLLMFDGQNILHGVTPIYLEGPEAFRYSIVYYSLKSMWNCLSPDEEVRRIQRLRTSREEKRFFKYLPPKEMPE
jgi:hypothetical protein